MMAIININPFNVNQYQIHNVFNLLLEMKAYPSANSIIEKANS